MSAVQVVEGTLKPDGTLELTGKLTLPPGQVRITVETLPDSPLPPTDLLTVLEQLEKARAERGESGTMTDDAAQSTEDAEYEARWRDIHAQTVHPLPPETDG